MALSDWLSDAVDVYRRTPEADTWTRLASEVAALITPVSAQGARREAMLLEPDVTHVGHMALNMTVAAGQRLKRVSDGAEFVVRAVRAYDQPFLVEQHTALSLTQEATAIA